MLFMTYMSRSNHASTLDLNLLVALHELLDSRNVTRAAARMGISQSAMSHKLRVLRDTLGDPLLVGPRGASVLTARAQDLAGPLRDALHALTRAVMPTEPFVPATAERVFRIAAGDIGELVVVPNAIAEIKRSAPHIKLELQPHGESMREALERGQLDFVVGARLPPFAGLMQKTIIHEPGVVVLRRGHPAARKLTLARYLELEHISITTGSVVDGALAKFGSRRAIGVTVTSLVAAAHLVARSDLALTTGLAFAAACARDLRVQVVAHPQLAVRFAITMSWHERTHRDPGAIWARALAERLTRQAVEHGAEALRGASEA